MPDNVLLDAFNLPPRQAIAFLKSKGMRFSWDWTDVWEKEHAKAFTVAKVMRMDILQDIRDSIDEALKNGESFAHFQKNLKPLLQAKGWWGPKMMMNEKGEGNLVQLGSPYRLRTIYQTNTQTALMAGRYQGMMQSTEMRPLWQYIHPPIAKVPRPDHVALNGRIFRYDDVFWQTHYPPNGFGCHCRVRSLSQREADRMGIKVDSGDGNMINKKVDLGNGKTATVTGFKTTHAGEPVTVWTDPGFNYNPGTEVFTPDLGRYDKGIVKEYEKITPPEIGPEKPVSQDNSEFIPKNFESKIGKDVLPNAFWNKSGRTVPLTVKKVMGSFYRPTTDSMQIGTRRPDKPA
jgi:SPP1 gp7 family putative phage head morphogenesis protein